MIDTLKCAQIRAADIFAHKKSRRFLGDTGWIAGPPPSYFTTQVLGPTETDIVWGTHVEVYVVNDTTTICVADRK